MPRQIEQAEPLSSCYIPDNALASKRIFGFKRRNIIEGAIFAGITCGIISLIPFVVRVKVIFMVLLGGSALFVGLLGIRNQSVTEAVINYRKYKGESGKYHYRLIENTPLKKRVISESTNVSESYADKIIRLVKGAVKDVKERQNYR